MTESLPGTYSSLSKEGKGEAPWTLLTNPQGFLIRTLKVVYLD